MTKEVKLWQSDFGDNYVDRNQITEENIVARINLYQGSLNTISEENAKYVPGSILEVGAGQGANLMAIKRLFDTHGFKHQLLAMEPNKKAYAELKKNVPGVIKVDNFGQLANGEIDLILTHGVLIHIHPDELLGMMKNIYAKSRRYIICTEYFSVEPREVLYHGEQALWTRDFGAMWLDNFKLRCVCYVFSWKRMTGLDNVTTWVMEKVN